MNAKEIAFILPEKPILKKILQITLAELGTAKNSEVQIEYNNIRYLFQNKLDFLSMLNELEEMDLMKIEGTANNTLGTESKGSRESLFMTLRAYMSFENSTHLIFNVNKKKILEVISSENRTSELNSTFTLTKNGLLFRKVNDSTQEYKMDKDSIPHKILKYLAENSTEATSTEDLMRESGTDNPKTIMNAISEFRRVIIREFKGVLPEEFLPRGQKNSGYRLGERVRIILE